MNVFKVKPNTYITMKVPRIEVGIARSTFKVVVQDPRKTQQTSPVSTEARTRVKRISPMAFSTKIVVSQFTNSVRPSGRLRAMSATITFTARPTSTAFAPRSLVTLKPTEGWPIERPMRRRSSRPSSTTATSLRRTGAPCR